MTLRLIIPCLLLFVSCLQLTAQENEHSQSPYFLIDGQNSKGGFPLLENKVNAVILGPIAEVTLRQTYQNNGNDPIEAVYVFPASTRAAVYHMEMHIGERTLIAEVQEKKEARKTYEKAKKEGKRSSLLEQHKPNVFQMNVANIMPGEKVSVLLKYTEFIIPEDQEYTFVFPTVVGPRYSGENPQKWADKMFKKYRKESKVDFDLSVTMRTSIPVTRINCDSHKMKMDQTRSGEIDLTLDKIEGFGGNRDFILKYRLAGNKIETGVKTFEKDGEHYFLCQLEAPVINSEAQIVPREYIFIVDVSGSMSGFPLSVSKTLMRNLFSKLRPSDRFNVMFFAGSAFVLSPESLEATTENIEFAMTEVESRKGGGGTNMLSAIKKAMRIPKETEYSRSFVIVTDGHVTVEEEAFIYIANHLSDSNFYAFGIGKSVNRFLIEGLAHVGKGVPFIVSANSEANYQAERLRKYIQFPVLSNIEIKGNKVELIDVIPNNIPDLTTGRPIYFFGKYDPSTNQQLIITGNQGCDHFKESLELPKPKQENLALSYLWAREKIRQLDDFNTLRNDGKKVKEITALGLKYNLLTKYTSFVAVDDEVVNEGGKIDLVNQVLSIPEGMSNLSIGFEMEIEELKSERSIILDVSIESEDAQFNQIAEFLLESILLESEESGILQEQSVQLIFNEYGVLVSDKNYPSDLLLEKLILALKDFGYDLKSKKFSLIIKKVKG